jgi:hypothetical protein
MTRINAPIPVEELCDIHLLSEIRELPRIFAYCAAWDGVTIRQPFAKLNKGHLLFWSRFSGYLFERYQWLRHEAHVRGFHTGYDDVGILIKNNLDPRNLVMARPSIPETYIAELRERICGRFLEMDRDPVWTVRTAPEWCREALEKRWELKNKHYTNAGVVACSTASAIEPTSAVQPASGEAAKRRPRKATKVSAAGTGQLSKTGGNRCVSTKQSLSAM